MRWISIGSQCCYGRRVAMTIHKKYQGGTVVSGLPHHRGFASALRVKMILGITNKSAKHPAWASDFTRRGSPKSANPALNAARGPYILSSRPDIAERVSLEFILVQAQRQRDAPRWVTSTRAYLDSTFLAAL